ncbi:MAG TPA: flippase-like domain-containing protein [Alphaproteobacteria bacterium]|nr:flippase-like domain-containing protein [Alphaproteobacteria bacterium]
MSKTLLKFICLAAGGALLAVVAGQVNIREVMTRSLQIGWGMAVILGLYFMAFLADTFSWQMTIPCIPLNKLWLYRVWKVQLVGEALNNVIPAAGLGGEPVKAMLLKRRYAIGYSEGITSLILIQAIILTSLLLFISVGFVLALYSDKISNRSEAIAVAGLLVIGLGVAAVVLLPHANLSSRIGRLAARTGLGERLEVALRHIGDIEKRLVDFYKSRRRRFLGALAMAVAPWILGVLEIYYASLFLGHPLSFAEAWIIESSVQMMRAAVPFIPGGLGVQEGVFVALLTAITGSPVLGGAIAMVRRFREIVWLAGGGVAGLTFFFANRAPRLN